VRRLALPLALLAVWAGTARAEAVYRGEPVTDARLAIGPAGEPIAAYIANGLLSLATRHDGAWTSQALFVLPSRNAELDGLTVSTGGRVDLLVRDRSGRWLASADQSGPAGWRLRLIRPDARRDLIGPGGLVLDAQQRPVVAYALWHPTHKTSLRLLRTDSAGRLRTTSITRKGYPPSLTIPAAAPVLLPTGQIRVVETFSPAAIEWSPIPGDWIGQFLHSSALGVPTGSIATAAAASTLYAAWTEAYPTLGPSPVVVLAVHGERASSAVAIENAVLAGLALTPEGPELAANRCAQGSCLGLVGMTGLDGLVAGFAVAPSGARNVLLATGQGLDWYRSPGALSVRVSLNSDLTGRVEGASGGFVSLFRERSDGSRTAVATFPVASDGSFAASDPNAGAPAAAHRAVYVDPTTSIPYAALAGASG
jgi:hypothetical protein